ncbi:MAG: hypothetical protein AAGI01_09750 [Myxococcota bacterium]
MLIAGSALAPGARAAPPEAASSYYVEHLRQVASAWSLEIAVPTTDEPLRLLALSCSAPKAIGLERVAVILEQELPLYPIKAIEAAPLDTIYLCSDLTIGATPVAGASRLESRAIFLEVDPGDAPVDYLRSVFHHEIAHVLEEFYSGPFQDEWDDHNLKSFEYLQATSSFGDVGLTWGTMTTPGFATAYGMTNPLEDRAELYAHLMTRFDATLARGERDAMLRAKTRALMRELSVKAPGMNADFWRLVRGHQVARARPAVAAARPPPPPAPMATGGAQSGTPGATCSVRGAADPSQGDTPIAWVVFLLTALAICAQSDRCHCSRGIPESGSQA